MKRIAKKIKLFSFTSLVSEIHTECFALFSIDFKYIPNNLLCLDRIEKRTRNRSMIDWNGTTSSNSSRKDSLLEVYDYYWVFAARNRVRFYASTGLKTLNIHSCKNEITCGLQRGLYVVVVTFGFISKCKSYFRYNFVIPTILQLVYCEKVCSQCFCQ